MKKLLFYCLLLVLVSACTKEKSEENTDTPSNYFVKFKVDGAATEFRDFVYGTKGVIDNEYYVAIQGQATDTSNFPGLGIYIQDTTEISERTYIEDFSLTMNALIYGERSSADFSSTFMTEPSGLEIEINKIDSVSVQGTFTGKVADLYGNIKNITEGSFSVRLQ